MLWNQVWKLCERQKSETLLFFLEQKYILFSETYFLKIPKNLITWAFFLPRQILKNIDMPWQKAQMLVKRTDWIIKNDHEINCAMFFCKWFKLGQTSNVIRLSTKWILIFRLEVANKKPLLVTKPAIIWSEVSCQKDITYYSYKILYVTHQGLLHRENVVC